MSGDPCSLVNVYWDGAGSRDDQAAAHRRGDGQSCRKVAPDPHSATTIGTADSKTHGFIECFALLLGGQHLGAGLFPRNRRREKGQNSRVVRTSAGRGVPAYTPRPATISACGHLYCLVGNLVRQMGRNDDHSLPIANDDVARARPELGPHMMIEPSKVDPRVLSSWPCLDSQRALRRRHGTGTRLCQSVSCW